MTTTPAASTTWYVTCNECKTHLRLQVITVGQAPVDRVFCPICGSPGQLQSQQPEQEYWYTLADSLGFPATPEGASLTKDLYDLWEPSEHSRFIDFVEAMRDD